jgi:hypothetical protein
MTKRIEVTEYQCNPTTFDLEEFVTAQTIDGMGNILGLDEGRMLDEEIDRLRNLAIGEAMPLGDPEAGLTVVRLTDNQMKTLNKGTMFPATQEQAQEWQEYFGKDGDSLASNPSCPWCGKDCPDAARPQGCWFPDCPDEPHA